MHVRTTTYHWYSFAANVDLRVQIQQCFLCRPLPQRPESTLPYGGSQKPPRPSGALLLSLSLCCDFPPLSPPSYESWCFPSLCAVISLPSPHPAMNLGWVNKQPGWYKCPKWPSSSLKWVILGGGCGYLFGVWICWYPLL